MSCRWPAGCRSGAPLAPSRLWASSLLSAPHSASKKGKPWPGGARWLSLCGSSTALRLSPLTATCRGAGSRSPSPGCAPAIGCGVLGLRAPLPRQPRARWQQQAEPLPPRADKTQGCLENKGLEVGASAPALLVVGRRAGLSHAWAGPGPHKRGPRVRVQSSPAILGISVPVCVWGLGVRDLLCSRIWSRIYGFVRLFSLGCFESDLNF